jgi:hypothetical protein
MACSSASKTSHQVPRLQCCDWRCYGPVEVIWYVVAPEPTRPLSSLEPSV